MRDLPDDALRRLTPAERVAMIVDAVAAGDDSHAARLHHTVPIFNLTGPDPEVRNLLGRATRITEGTVLALVDVLHRMEFAEFAMGTWISWSTHALIWDRPADPHDAEAMKAFEERVAEREQLEDDLSAAVDRLTYEAALLVEVHRRCCDDLDLDGSVLLQYLGGGVLPIDRHADRLAAVDLDEDQVVAAVKEFGRAMV